jgi:hypothetical protein
MKRVRGIRRGVRGEGSGLPTCISMARPPRMEFPGAFYHVIVRGHERQDLFMDDQDGIEDFIFPKPYEDFQEI